jgi:hypothetical protein
MRRTLAAAIIARTARWRAALARSLRSQALASLVSEA